VLDVARRDTANAAMRSKLFLRALIPNNTIVLGANEAPFDIA
jgi:hypothetical protein